MQLSSLFTLLATFATAALATPIAIPDAGLELSRSAAEAHWLKYSGLHRSTFSPSVAAAIKQVRDLEEARAAAAFVVVAEAEGEEHEEEGDEE
jgi:hypothetical protein